MKMLLMFAAVVLSSALMVPTAGLAGTASSILI